MPTQVQFRRGTTAQNNNFTGATGEISIDTSTNAIRVHDGITAGGTAILPTLKITNAQRLALTPALGQIIFVTDYASAGVSPTWVGDGVTVGGVIAAGTVVASASTASNILGGTAGQVPYQTGVGTTNFFGPGSYGQLLLSGGNSGPSYTNTLTITNGVVRINGSTNATSTTTGALVITGGLGVGQDLYVGGKIVAQELDIQYTTVTTTLIQTDDIIKTTNTTNATSTTTGALVISGGVGIGGDVQVGGNITAQGNIVANGNITLGNQTTDTLTIGAEINSDVLPYANATYNLGSSTLAWKRIWTGDLTASGTVTATTFVGALSQSLTAGTGLTGTAYNGSAAQTWTLNTATLMQSSVNLASGGAGSIPYQSAANATTFLSIGTNGYVLTSNGSAPVWAAASGITAGSATTATSAATAYSTIGTHTAGTGLSGTAFNGSANQTWTLNTATLMQTSVNLGSGSAGQLAYQTAANATGFINTATTGNFLQANYVGAPTWTTTASMYVNRATLADAVNNSLTIGTGLSGTSGTYNGGAAVTVSLNTATLMQVATQVVQSHSTGTGILGSAYNGSTAQTWSLDTSTLMARAVQTVQSLTAGTGLTGTAFNGSAAQTFALNTATLMQTSVNLGSGAAGSLPYQTAANATGFLAIGTNGYVLTSNGTAPTWSALSGLSAGSATTATSAGTAYSTIGTLSAGAGLTGTSFNGSVNYTWTLNTATLMQTSLNLANGTAGQLVYQTAANTSGFINTATTGNFLQANYVGAPTWTTTASMYVQDAVVSTNLRAGAAGSLPYQSAANATAYLGIGGAGTMMVSSGSAPTWTATASIYVNRATISDQVLTVSQPASASYFLTFVDSNNASGLTELVYTTSSFYINPASGLTNLQSLSINSTAYNTQTNTANALYVAGGIFASGGLTVDSTGPVLFKGPVTFGGTATYVLSTNTFYTDNILEMHTPPGGVYSPWFSDDGKDIGFRFHYYTNSTDTNAALVLANDTKYLEWYNSGAESSLGSFNTATYGTFKTGAIKLAGGTANAGNTSTGDLTVLGGVGIGGSVYVGGNITVAGTITANITGVSTTATNIAGGVAGQLNYQTAPGLTGFVNTATTGNFLQANYSGAPTWTTTANIYVNRATVADSVANALTVGTGLTGSVSTYNGSAAVTVSLNTATLIATATQVVQSHSTGTGILGSAYNGSTAQTWSLDTSTLMARAVQTVQSLTAGAGLTGTAFNGSTAQTWTLNTATLMATSVNLASGAAGSLPYQTAANATGFLAIGTNGFVLTSNGTAPTWAAVSGLSAGSATTATNLAGGTAGQVPYQTAAGSTSFYGPGTAGQLLVSAGAAAPVYTNTASIYVQDSNVSTNLRAGTAGQLHYQTAANTSGFINTATTGNFLQANYVGAPTWTTTASMYVQDASVSTNLRAGAAGSLPYQSAANATAFLSIGTNGYVLTSNGSAPVWSAASGITAGSATTATSAATAYSTIGTLTAGTGLSGTAFNGSANQTWTLNTATLMQTSVNLGSGAAGSLPYQSAANATAFLSIGSANSILVSNGSAPSWTVNPTIGGNVTITGNLTVQGATTTVDSTVTNVADPIITIGGGAGGAAPASNDGKDRGIAFQWHNGTVAKVGFFGYKNSSGKMTFIPDATVTSEVVSGTKGAIDINLAGGSAGSLPYQSAADTTTFLGIGTNGYVLTSNGSAPVWTAASGITSGSATTATSAGTAYATIGTLTAGTGLSGTAFNGSANQTWTLASAYGDSINPYASKTANYVLAAPNGTAGAPTFRALVAADIPTLNQNTTGQAGSVANALTAGTGISYSAGTTYNGSAAITINNAGVTSAVAGTGVAVSAATGAVTISIGQSVATSVSPTFAGGTFNGLTQISNNTAINTATPGLGNYGLHFTGQTTADYAAGITWNGGTGTTGAQAGIYVQGSGAYGTKMYIATTDSYASGSKTAVSIDHTGAVVITRGAFTANSSQISSLGVGTAASGTAGEIRATNEITAYYSDRRLKENVVVIGNAVEKVKSLNGITYTPNDIAAGFGYDKTVKLVGLFADEVEAVLPEATRPAPFDQDENGNSKSGENYKTIQYEKLVPLLVEAIKEQQVTIDSLKTELEEVKKLLGK
jgi:hypothetical protein